MQERFVFFSRVAASLHDKRPVNAELGAGYGLLGGHVEWNFYTLLFQHGTGLSSEAPDRRRVKNACPILQAHGQFLNQGHEGCVLLDVSHMPPPILSVFSYSWSSEKKRVRLRVIPCYLFQSQLSNNERPYHPLLVSFFPSSFYSESCTSLQILIRWKCCSTTLCPRSLEKPVTYVFWIWFWIEWRGPTVDGTGADTQTLHWNSTQKIGKST